MVLPRALVRLLAPLLVLALGLTAVMPGPQTAAVALELAGFWQRWQASDSVEQRLEPSPPAGRLQQVAPPPGVQQLQQGLASHLPQITIASPRDGALLGQGDWTLVLDVRDWPLVDAGELGLGAHVAVQIDSQPPQRFTASNTGAGDSSSPESGDRHLALDLPPLTPGSHRITVYAAYPWGEAVKLPGASRQIRLHRLAANPQTLPAPGTPQLLAVSPPACSQAEPLLLDWLLLDAPLQNLREGDGSWRLKTTINSDTFLVDQNVALWLKGWKNGSNSLKLELVDGFGEPLNRPFNSVVQEVMINACAAAAPTPWLQRRLSTGELDRLLGKASAEPASMENAPLEAIEPEQSQSAAAGRPIETAPAGTSPDETTPANETIPADETTPADENTPADVHGQPSGPQDSDEPSSLPASEPPQQSEPATGTAIETAPEPTVAVESEAASDPASDPASQLQGVGMDPVAIDEPEIAAEPETAAEPDAAAELETDSEPEAAGEAQAADEPEANADATAEKAPSSETGGAVTADSEAEPSGQGESQPLAELQLVGEPQPPADAAEEPEAAALLPSPERVVTTTQLEGSARELVNPDGSLIQMPPSGPLSRLRQLITSP